MHWQDMLFMRELELQVATARRRARPPVALAGYGSAIIKDALAPAMTDVTLVTLAHGRQ